MKESKFLEQSVKQGYHQNFVIDYTLPSASVGLNSVTWEKQKHFSGGFPFGFVAFDTKLSYIFNHLNIYISYQQPDPLTKAYHIVQFAVEPMSIAESAEGPACVPNEHMEGHRIEQNQMIYATGEIVYTYDVIWIYSDVSWSNRWEIYLSEDHLVPIQVHVYSILNSALVLGILFVIVLVIWICRLRKAAKLTPLSRGDDEEGDDEEDNDNMEVDLDKESVRDEFVIVPVSRQAIADALEGADQFYERQLLTKLLSSHVSSKIGCDFEDWVIESAS